MKNKQILIIFLIGATLTILGAFFKIMQFSVASLLLIVGMTFEALAGFFLLRKLFKKGKSGSFLDS